MAKGIVKWYNELKGFGFIETENEKDVFVHRTGLADPSRGLQTGDKVVFETEQGEKGLNATDVKPEE